MFLYKEISNFSFLLKKRTNQERNNRFQTFFLTTRFSRHPRFLYKKKKRRNFAGYLRTKCREGAFLCILGGTAGTKHSVPAVFELAQNRQLERQVFINKNVQKTNISIFRSINYHIWLMNF